MNFVVKIIFQPETLFSEASTHNDAHAPPSVMSSDATHTAVTDTSGDIATATTPASLVSPQTAIPRLPDHLVVAHILISEYFGDDPADLARLRPVSRGIRAAVSATGLRFAELGEISAVYIGCLSALERRQRQGRLSRQKYLCEGAARSGHLEVLQWLRANGCPWDGWTCKYAAEGGHLEVLQWARKQGCAWDGNTCAHAALKGHLEVLQWLRANGCPWGMGTCKGAAEGGHLEMLQWARANGCPWNANTCTYAALGGHLAVLQWARANGCPWDESTCWCAAMGGHLEVLQWARANGCPWDRDTRRFASGHILEWAVANGAPLY